MEAAYRAPSCQLRFEVRTGLRLRDEILGGFPIFREMQIAIHSYSRLKGISQFQELIRKTSNSLLFLLAFSLNSASPRMPRVPHDPASRFFEYYGRYLIAKKQKESDMIWLNAVACRVELRKMGDPTQEAEHCRSIFKGFASQQQAEQYIAISATIADLPREKTNLSAEARSA
jgi:hypothetical protein